MSEKWHQPPPIIGYREIENHDLELVNDVKAMEERVAELWKDVDGDPRLKAIARTHFQEGFSALVRSILKPRDPFIEEMDT